MSAPGLKTWLERIERMHPQEIELGLERISEVLDTLSIRKPAPNVITVGGTNGKGSCIAFLEAALRAGGYRYASYTSPHLWRFNERIKLSGVEASDEDLVACFEQVEAARGDIPLTYFEFSTAAAFVYFARTNVDVALLEVGLGGRLDAVNAIDPDVCVLSSIDVDHKMWLGEDRVSIGREKAAIFRRGCAAICGDLNPPDSVLETADALQARLLRIGHDFEVEQVADGWLWRGPRRSLSLDTPLLAGEFQLANAACALTALDELEVTRGLAPALLRKAVSQAHVPGRMQVLGGEVSWVFDVAHNAHAAAALAAYLQATRDSFPGRTLAVVGMMQDKDVVAVGKIMSAQIAHWICTSLPRPRGWQADALAQQLRAVVQSPLDTAPSLEQACAQAREMARPGDRVVVFGSFLTVGPALAGILST